MATPSRLPSIVRRPVEDNGQRPVSTIKGDDARAKTPPLSVLMLRSIKRRSLLPQLNRKVSGDERALSTALEEEGDSDLGPDEEEDEVKARDDMAHARGAALRALEAQDEPNRQIADRRAMPPPPPPRTSSKLARASSTRPSSSKQLPAYTNTESLSRATSKAGNGYRPGVHGRITPTTSPAKEHDVKLPGSNALPSIGHRTTPSRTTIEKSKGRHGRSDSSSTTASRVSDKRGSRGTRPRSTTASSMGSADISPASPTSPSQNMLRAKRRTQMLPPPKPAFNTYQQHYSPTKAAQSKPPVPSARPSRPQPVAESDTSVGFETFKQQVELLRLSLLHQEAGQTLIEYEGSAYHKLSRKHARLQRMLEAIKNVERPQKRCANLVALDTWCPEANLLAQSLHTLSRTYDEVQTLTGPGGRYDGVVMAFSEWMEHIAGEMVPTLPSSSSSSAPPPQLDEGWHQAHASLSLKLRSLQRGLASLPPLPPSCRGASVGILVTSCTSLVDGMLKELDVMTELEKDTLARERRRIDEQIHQITLDSAALRSQLPWIPAWEMAGGEG